MYFALGRCNNGLPCASGRTRTFDRCAIFRHFATEMVYASFELFLLQICSRIPILGLVSGPIVNQCCASAASPGTLTCRWSAPCPTPPKATYLRSKISVSTVPEPTGPRDRNPVTFTQPAALPAIIDPELIGCLKILIVRWIIAGSFMSTP